MAEGIVMVQSINTKVDLVIEGTSHMGLTDYGKIMIGDKGFEFLMIATFAKTFRFLGRRLIW